MAVHQIIFVIFTMVCYLKAIINPYGPTVVNDCANCIKSIIEREFTKPGLIIFANTNNVSTSVLRIRTELLKDINKEIKFSIEVMSPSKEVEVCDTDIDKLGVLHVDHFTAIPSADYFLIIVDSYRDFSYLASKLIRSRSWNPLAKFIILVFSLLDTDKSKTEYVENILSCLFKYNAINVVIALPQANNYRNAFIYSWKPYDPPKYCGYFNETAKNRLIQENTCVHGVLKYDKNVFSNKISNNMTGCILNILALQRQPYISENKNDANIETIFINRLLKSFKMTGKYHLISGFRGERENIGEWNGGLRMLVKKKAHILIGGIFPDYDVHEDFESSTTYLSDAYTWVVPRADKLPPWTSFLIIFQGFVWYSAISAFFICAMSWSFIGHLCGESLYNTAFDHCFINTWISLFGFVAYKRPIKGSLRVFFVFLNLYSVLFLTAYQTKLFDTLTNPAYEYQIQTVEELVESGLKFGGFEELHDLYYNSSDPFDYYIGEKWIVVENITAAMIDVAVHKNFSVLCSRLELAHISSVLPELNDASGDQRYYAFELNMFSVPVEIVALRGFPYMHEFSNYISLSKQSGLNDALRDYNKKFNERRRARLLRSFTDDDPDVDPLSVQHLEGGFLALALGYVGGTLTLVIEIAVNSKYIRRKLYQC